ncbi:helix-turn-helix domain-containing protein [Glaciihabitans sp. GrIS 2.15]|uniref:helix-turn-helix domain-containing protein n=1 Tax=Glaciihabitans sp. GrIS 2.15 TaxID=3071710 RepID=UPI002E04C624|nr:hypothetical protein [Glaciihabitans sp. GrIS 2.15]
MTGIPSLDRLTYPVAEVIRLSGLSREEIYRRVKSGELDSLRVGAKGGKIAIPAAALMRLLNGTSPEGADPS